jgi:membrane-bound lytic murein transglycosylase D
MKKVLVLFVLVSAFSASYSQSADEAKPMVDDLQALELPADSLNIPAFNISSIPSDSIPRFPEEVIKERLQYLEKNIPLTYNNITRGFIDYFTVRNREYSRLMIQRKEYYFPMFVEALKRHGMPEELKYLAVVESGLHPRAMSRVGAAGLWQFMPYTGKQFELYQTDFIDERLDPYKATEAACLYLKQLYNIFNDWELAIASYNCGPGNVRKAIRRSGGKRNFWKVYNYLPRETRSYLPQFIALAYTLEYYEPHLLQPSGFDTHQPMDTLHTHHPVNLLALSHTTGLCLEDLLHYNPSLRKPYLPGNINYSLRLPQHVMPAVHANYYCLFDTLNCFIPFDADFHLETGRAFSKQSVAFYNKGAKTVYRVKNGEVLGSIARKFGVTVSQIKAWNRLHRNTIYVGQKLVLYSKPSAAYQVSQAPAKKSNVQKKQTNSTRIYSVQSGDTLWSIAQSHSISVEELKKLNRLKGNTIKTGMKLKIG